MYSEGETAGKAGVWTDQTVRALYIRAYSRMIPVFDYHV